MAVDQGGGGGAWWEKEDPADSPPASTWEWQTPPQNAAPAPSAPPPGSPWTGPYDMEPTGRSGRRSTPVPNPTQPWMQPPAEPRRTPAGPIPWPHAQPQPQLQVALLGRRVLLRSPLRGKRTCRPC